MNEDLDLLTLCLEAFPKDQASTSTASFSPCRRYRYELWRRWGSGKFCMFIGLNPSTADELNDDPTIRRCIAYAKSWGYDALCMTNLFAFRATQPKDMMAEPDPVGPENDSYLSRLSKDAGVIVAAWGKDGRFKDREKAVLKLIPGLSYLKLNKDKTPAHPLYLKSCLTPIPFDP